MNATTQSRYPLWLAAALVLFTINIASAADTKAASTNKGLVPLTLELPAPTTKGTPDNIPEGPHIEKVPDLNAMKPRPAMLVPPGIKNVALGKKITTSSDRIDFGTLDQITDGRKEAFDDDVVELRRGKQWVQLDLEKEYELYAIVVWHDHSWLQVFHDVIIQSADDALFTKNVKTLFNNDVDNSAGLGLGTDKEYFETYEGKLIDVKGVKARYLRFYTNGSSMNQAANKYQEVEVYALQPK